VPERDAVRLAMSIAGIDAEPLQEWTGASPADGFLRNLAYEAHEDVLLAYDAARFPGLTALPSERPDWILFGDDCSHIRVASVNNTPLEQTVGVDLIYLSAHRGRYFCPRSVQADEEGWPGPLVLPQ
jgi:hypothetical protein